MNRINIDKVFRSSVKVACLSKGFLVFSLAGCNEKEAGADESEEMAEFVTYSGGSENSPEVDNGDKDIINKMTFRVKAISSSELIKKMVEDANYPCSRGLFVVKFNEHLEKPNSFSKYLMSDEYNAIDVNFESPDGTNRIVFYLGDKGVSTFEFVE